MTGVASFSVVIANLLCSWVAYSVLGATSTSATTTTVAATATDVQPARRIPRVRAATSQATFRITPPVLVNGKVS